MENPIVGNSYRRTKQQAKSFYSKFGLVWCSAFGEYIHFDETGFRHLIQKGKKFRPRSEQKRRFALLLYIKGILNDPAVSIHHEQGRNNRDTRYWVFKAQRGRKLVKVVVRQVGNGRKHFLSIYGKDKNPHHKDVDS